MRSKQQGKRCDFRQAPLLKSFNNQHGNKENMATGKQRQVLQDKGLLLGWLV